MSADCLVVPFPNVWELTDDRTIVLGKLHLSLDLFSRGVLAMMVLKGFERESSYARHSARLFTFLSKYDDLDVAIDCVTENLDVDDTAVNTLIGVSKLFEI